MGGFLFWAVCYCLVCECVQTFKDVPQLGRFTLRDEGKTIGSCVFFLSHSFVFANWLYIFAAMGKIIELHEADMVQSESAFA